MGFFYFCRAELNMAKKEKVVKNKKKEILTMEDLL